MRPGVLSLVILLFPWTALAGKGSVSVVCVEPPRGGGAYRAAAAATLALRQELASRGRKIVDPSSSLYRAGKASAAKVAEGRAMVKAAVMEYDSLEFGKAAEQLGKAVGDFREALALDPGALPGAEYAKALHYRGAAAFYNGDQETAARYFQDAMAFAPGAMMDDAVFPPDLAKQFNNVREALTHDGEIKVESTPPAETYINGEPAGVTPYAATGLPPGTHLVRVQAAGYRPATRWVEVKAGREAVVTLTLKPGKKLKPFTSAVASVRAELVRSRPGPGVARLTKLVRASSLVLVTWGRGETIQATWAEGGFWVKRHQARVAEGREPLFAQHFIDRGAPVTPKVECRNDRDCTGGLSCTDDGRCLASSKGGETPIYKKWWLWTIVGAVVVGGTVGVVVGTQSDKWTAAVRPGEWP